jgi:DNA-binding transcriptional LysR family regulator
LLLPLPGTAFRDELDAVTRPLGITLLPAAEIDGLRLIASLTFEGYGPAILPATAIPSYLRAQFHPLSIEGLPRRRVGVAQRSRGLPSAPTRALVDLLREVVARPEDRPEGVHVTA